MVQHTIRADILRVAQYYSEPRRGREKYEWFIIPLQKKEKYEWFIHDSTKKNCYFAIGFYFFGKSIQKHPDSVGKMTLTMNKIDSVCANDVNNTKASHKIVNVLIIISWSFHGCHNCCLRQPWKYYENTNGEKMRTLLAMYTGTFIGFALLYQQTVTSCPLRGLWSFCAQINHPTTDANSLRVRPHK